MSKLTKQHFESAAEEIRTSYKLKTRREKNIVMNFLAEWFKQWNPEFRPEQFKEACHDYVTTKQTGGLKRALKKYKRLPTPEQVFEKYRNAHDVAAAVGPAEQRAALVKQIDELDENIARGLCKHGAPYAGRYCLECKRDA